jgi:transcriptional regulator with XRE-family HTH domain
MSTFSDWITKKYLNWQAEVGKRKTIDDFAAYLGISRPLLNMWMNGDKPRPGPANIKLLAEIYGNEVYDAVGIPRPNPYLEKINQVFENISEDHQRQLAEDAERYVIGNHAERIQNLSKKRKTAKDQS